MSRKLHLVIFLIAISLTSTFAATIKGKLLDENKEPMIGAHVYIKEATHYAVVGLDGSYILTNVPVGSHVLTASFVGYESQEIPVTIASGSDIINIDINLKQDPKLLREIVITQKAEGGSDLEARKNEKYANNVVNIVSARTIEISPDVTVANVIQRVSGVSLVRNSSGDPQYAIIRGMDKRYNYTLVNGIKIPSPDNQNRYIPLDIFPASLLERLEVSKTLTPSMEGDAIGGVVNMVMKSAPEQRMVKADFQLGYNQIFIKQPFLSFNKSAVDYKTPYDKYGSLYRAQISDFSKKNLDIKPITPLPDMLGSFSIGDRFFKNKLGVLLAGSLQNSYRGTNSVWFKTLVDETGSNLPSFESVQERTYSTQQTRTAYHGRFDYKLNDKNTFKLYAGNYHLKNAQTRDLLETQLDERNYDEEAGNGILTYATRTRIVDQNIFTTTLNGEHQLLPLLFANWSMIYSKATNKEPDNATFERDAGLKDHVESAQIVDRTQPHEWTNNTDKDLSGYINLLYRPMVFGHISEFSFGGLYRKKDRLNSYNRYHFGPTNPSTQTKGEEWDTYSDVNLEVLNPLGGIYDPRNYSATENLFEGYVQGKFNPMEHVQIITGVRIEQTKQGYRLLFPSLNETPDSTQHYTDVLPSLNVKYALSQNMNIRSSYYKAICRPGYSEINPAEITNGDDYPVAGDKNLKHVKSDNIDLRFEYFPSAFDQIFIGTFYKKITDPIEYALRPSDGVQSIASIPGNYGTAHNWGIELDITKYFSKFGFKANYTFTSSKITSTKYLKTRQDPNDQSSPLVVRYADQTRPLQGQAKHIANFSILYKNQEMGTDAQLAFVYTGERLETISPFLDNDFWVKPILQMDFSAEQKVNKHFIVFIRAQNLLNSPYEVVIKKQHANPEKPYKLQPASSSTLVRKDQYYQSFRIGIRYAL